MIAADGLTSGFYQSYLSPFQPPRPVLGPYQIISSRTFYTGWYLRYATLDAPFLPPDRIFLTVDTPVPLRRGTAWFKRSGGKPVHLSFKGLQGAIQAGVRARVLFDIKRQSDIDTLLSAADWEIVFDGANGHDAFRVAWRFPLDIEGLQALHARHVANMREIQNDIPGRCQRDATEEVI